MKVRVFEDELWLPQDPETLFPFFGDASNLERITPPWLHFQIITPTPIQMEPGALIDYRLRVRGLPMRWRTRIDAWEPPFRFVDQQIRGPYRRGVHQHTFEAKDGGTLIRDRVEYAVPFDLLVHGWLVQPDIRTIFQFRKTSLQTIFETDPSAD